MEKVVTSRQLYVIIKDLSIINVEQSGFQQGRSTNDALSQLCQNITQNLIGRKKNGSGISGCGKGV